MLWAAPLPDAVKPDPTICYPDATSVNLSNSNIPK